MASMATAGADYDNHRVSPLPRAGALLIALLVTAAGVAPLFSGGEPARTIVPPGSLEHQAAAGEKTEAPLSLLNGLQLEIPAEQQASDAATPAADPAAGPETATPATPRT
ncbi:MAG: hypothetical protein ACYC5A_10020 [Thermoleophilia bacterium]